MRFLTNLDVYGSINLFGELKVNDKSLITIGEDGGMQLASSAYFINDGDTKVTLNDLDVQIKSIRTDFDALVGNEEAISGAIDTFNEIKLFLADYQDSDLKNILDTFVNKNALNSIGNDFVLDGSGIRLGSGTLELDEIVIKNSGKIVLDANHDGSYITADSGIIELGTGFTIKGTEWYAEARGLFINGDMTPTLDFLQKRYSPTPGNALAFGEDNFGNLYVGKIDGTNTLYIGSDDYANIVTPEATLYLSSSTDTSLGCKLSVAIDEKSSKRLLAVNDKVVLTEADLSIVKNVVLTKDNDNVDGTYTTSIEHNFNYMYPSVTVYDSNNRLVVCNVVATSVNEIEITLNEAGTYNVSIRK